MQLYQCKVRLNSQPNHEVQKTNVTVPEIIVLRHLHSAVAEGVGGYEPIDGIKPLPGQTAKTYEDAYLEAEDGKPQKKKWHPRTEREERARLHALYGVALRKSKDRPSIDAIFGVGIPLPKITDGMDVVEVDEPIRRPGRPPKVAADPLAELA